MKSSVSLSPQRKLNESERSQSRSKYLERWFKETYSPHYLTTKFSSSLDNSSLRFTSPTKRMQRSRSSCDSSARRYFKKLAESKSPRYMSPTYSVLRPESPGEYAVGCSVCGCDSIKNVSYTQGESPPRVKPSYKSPSASLRDPDSGAYACIYKKVTKPYHGEESEQIEVRSSRIIEDFTPEKYTNSKIEVIKTDPNYQGPEVSEIYYKEIIPPGKSSMTPMNWEDRKMVAETMYHNAVAYEYVREEERLRVAMRRSEYSNRPKGFARDMVVTSINGKDDSQEIVKQLVKEMTAESRDEALNSLLTPQRELSARHSTDTAFTPLKVDQPKEFSLVMQEKKENALGYRKLKKGGEKILPNRRNRFSRDQHAEDMLAEELKIPNMRKSPNRKKNLGDTACFNSERVAKQNEERSGDGLSDNSLEMQSSRKSIPNSQSGRLERVWIRKDNKLNSDQQSSQRHLNLSKDESDSLDNIQSHTVAEEGQVNSARKTAPKEGESLPYFYRTAANGSKKGNILKAIRERSANSEFVNNIKAEVYSTLSIPYSEPSRRPISSVLEESKKPQNKGAVVAKKPEELAKARSRSPTQPQSAKKGSKLSSKASTTDSSLRRNIKPNTSTDKLSNHSKNRLSIGSHQRSDSNLQGEIPDIDSTLSLEIIVHPKNTNPFSTSSILDKGPNDQSRDVRSFLSTSLPEYINEKSSLQLSCIPEDSDYRARYKQDYSETDLILESPGKKSISEKLSIEDSDIEHDNIRIKKLDEALCTESIKGDEKETMFEISLRANSSKEPQDKVKPGTRKPVSQYFKDIKDSKPEPQYRLKVESAEIEPEASPNRVDTSEDLMRRVISPNGICSEQEVEFEASPSRGSDKATSVSQLISPVPNTKHSQQDSPVDYELETPRQPVYQTEYTPLMGSPILTDGISPETQLQRIRSDPSPNTQSSVLNLTKSNSKPEYINAKVTYSASLPDKKGISKDSYFSQKYDKLLQEIHSMDALDPSRSSRSDHSNPSIQTQVQILPLSNEKPGLFTGSSFSSACVPSDEKYLHPSQETKIFIEESPRFIGSDTLRSAISDPQTEIYYEDNESSAFYQESSEQESEIYPVNIEREYEDRGMSDFFSATPGVSEEIELKFSSKNPAPSYKNKPEESEEVEEDPIQKLTKSCVKDFRTNSDGYLKLKSSTDLESPTFDRGMRPKVNSEPFSVRLEDDKFVLDRYPQPKMMKAVSITDLEPADLKSFSGSDSNAWPTPRDEIEDIEENQGSLRYNKVASSRPKYTFTFEETESDSEVRGSDGDFRLRVPQARGVDSIKLSQKAEPIVASASPKFKESGLNPNLPTNKEVNLPIKPRQIPIETFEDSSEVKPIRGLNSSKPYPVPPLRRNNLPNHNAISEIIKSVDLKPQSISSDSSRRLRLRESTSSSAMINPSGISIPCTESSRLASSRQSDAKIKIYDDHIVSNTSLDSFEHFSQDSELERVKEIHTQITKKLIDKRTGEELKRTTKSVDKKTVKSHKYAEILAKYSRGRRTISQDMCFNPLHTARPDSSKFPYRVERSEHRSVEPQELSNKLDRILDHLNDDRVMKGLKLLGGFVNYLEKDGNIVLNISRD